MVATARTVISAFRASLSSARPRPSFVTHTACPASTSSTSRSVSKLLLLTAFTACRGFPDHHLNLLTSRSSRARPVPGRRCPGTALSRDSPEPGQPSARTRPWLAPCAGSSATRRHVRLVSTQRSQSGPVPTVAAGLSCTCCGVQLDRRWRQAAATTHTAASGRFPRRPRGATSRSGPYLAGRRGRRRRPSAPRLRRSTQLHWHTHGVTTLRCKSGRGHWKRDRAGESGVGVGATRTAAARRVDKQRWALRGHRVCVAVRSVRVWCLRSLSARTVCFRSVEPCRCSRLAVLGRRDRAPPGSSGCKRASQRRGANVSVSLFLDF